MKALTVQEIDRLLADTKDLRLRTAIMLGFRHGLRVSEIVGLRRADVDLTNRKIVVRRLKNSLTTIQDLANCEVAMLTELLQNAIRSPYVFSSARTRDKNGAGHLTRHQLARLFKAACRASGVTQDKAHPHTLKHSLAFALVAANVTLPLIQRALGHRSINSTAVYTMPTDEMAGQAIQAALGGL